MIISRLPLSVRLAGAVVVGLAASSSLAGCASDTAAAIAPQEVAFTGGHVDSAAFATAMTTPAVTLLDVRTPAEFAAGHLPGAINLDVQSATFATDLATLDPEGNYAVYCRSGNRSRAAMQTMASAGYANTVGLEGGIGAWSGETVTE